MMVGNVMGIVGLQTFMRPSIQQVDGTVKVVRTGPTPAETLRAALDDPAFDPLRLKLAAVEDGPLAGYTFEKEEAGFSLVGDGAAPEGAAAPPVELEGAEEEGFAMVEELE